jgi:queuine tRNA-ribosyltransferase
LKGIELGVDIFDSRMPTQSAEEELYIGWEGKIKIILNEKYKFDYSKIDEKCDCFVLKIILKPF